MNTRSGSISVGDRFGKWVVCGEPFIRVFTGPKSVNRVKMYPCRCDCGSERPVRAFKLLSNSTSCGCEKKRLLAERNTIHGDASSLNPDLPRLYKVWTSMIQRCSNKSFRYYEYYGDRGIKVCEEWRRDYPTFKSWAIKNGYKAGLTIDRIDNNGNYEPGNCRWVTRKVQMRNTRFNVYLTAANEIKTLFDWSQDPRCSISAAAIASRINRRGWDAEKAIFSPPLTNNQHSGGRDI